MSYVIMIRTVHGDPEFIVGNDKFQITIRPFHERAVVQVFQIINIFFVVAIAQASGESREVLGVYSLTATSGVGGRGTALDTVLVVDVVIIVIEGFEERDVHIIVKVIVVRIAVAGADLSFTAVVLVAVIFVAEAPGVAVEVVGSDSLAAVAAVIAVASSVASSVASTEAVEAST